jgi:hypothetical protein
MRNERKIVQRDAEIPSRTTHDRSTSVCSVPSHGERDTWNILDHVHDANRLPNYKLKSPPNYDSTKLTEHWRNLTKLNTKGSDEAETENALQTLTKLKLWVQQIALGVYLARRRRLYLPVILLAEVRIHFKLRLLAPLAMFVLGIPLSTWSHLPKVGGSKIIS